MEVVARRRFGVAMLAVALAAFLSGCAGTGDVASGKYIEHCPCSEPQAMALPSSFLELLPDSRSVAAAAAAAAGRADLALVEVDQAAAVNTMQQNTRIEITETDGTEVIIVYGYVPSLPGKLDHPGNDTVEAVVPALNSNGTSSDETMTVEGQWHVDGAILLQATFTPTFKYHHAFKVRQLLADLLGVYEGNRQVHIMSMGAGGDGNTSTLVEYSAQFAPPTRSNAVSVAFHINKVDGNAMAQKASEINLPVGFIEVENRAKPTFYPTGTFNPPDSQFMDVLEDPEAVVGVLGAGFTNENDGTDDVSKDMSWVLQMSRNEMCTLLGLEPGSPECLNLSLEELRARAFNALLIKPRQVQKVEEQVQNLTVHVDTTNDTETDTVCVCKRHRKPSAPTRCERMSLSHDCVERDEIRKAGYEVLPPGVEEKMFPGEGVVPPFPLPEEDGSDGKGKEGEGATPEGPAAPVIPQSSEQFVRVPFERRAYEEAADVPDDERKVADAQRVEPDPPSSGEEPLSSEQQVRTNKTNSWIEGDGIKCRRGDEEACRRSKQSLLSQDRLGDGDASRTTDAIIPERAAVASSDALVPSFAPEHGVPPPAKKLARRGTGGGNEVPMSSEGGGRRRKGALSKQQEGVGGDLAKRVVGEHKGTGGAEGGPKGDKVLDAKKKYGEEGKLISDEEREVVSHVWKQGQKKLVAGVVQDLDALEGHVVKQPVLPPAADSASNKRRRSSKGRVAEHLVQEPELPAGAFSQTDVAEGDLGKAEEVVSKGIATQSIDSKKPTTIEGIGRQEAEELKRDHANDGVELAHLTVDILKRDIEQKKEKLRMLGN